MCKCRVARLIKIAENVIWLNMIIKSQSPQFNEINICAAYLKNGNVAFKKFAAHKLVFCLVLERLDLQKMLLLMNSSLHAL